MDEDDYEEQGSMDDETMRHIFGSGDLSASECWEVIGNMTKESRMAIRLARGFWLAALMAFVAGGLVCDVTSLWYTGASLILLGAPLLVIGFSSACYSLVINWQAMKATAVFERYL